MTHVGLSIERQPPHRITWIEDLTLTRPYGPDKPSQVDLIFRLHGDDQRIKLRLQTNDYLLSRLENVHYLSSDGGLSGVKPASRLQSSVFKGEALVNDVGNNLWHAVGTARIAIREADEGVVLFDGTFTVGGERFHVQLDSTFRRMQPGRELPAKEEPFMVVWRDGDELGQDLKRDAQELKCGLDSSGLSSQSLLRHHAPSLWNRQTSGSTDLRDTIGSTSGCPTTRLIALVGIATDCSYTSDFGSAAEVEANVISQVNSASQVYEDTFNISLAIRNLSISDASCTTTSSSSSVQWNVACSDSVDTRERLSRFSSWRGQFRDGNAVWTLLSGCRTGSTVGISWLGEVCQQGSSSFTSDGVSQTSSSTNIVIRNAQEWQVIAHEIGHSFGATHDCTSDTCSDTTAGDSSGCCPLSATECNANGDYIMNPSASSGIRDFSPCSVGAICSAIGDRRVDTSCLVDDLDGVSVIETPTCATASSCDFTIATAGPTEDPTINTVGGGGSGGGGGSRSWLDENRNAVIVAASVGGSFVILIIAACVFCRVRRRRRVRMLKEAQVSAMQYQVNRVVYR